MPSNEEKPSPHRMVKWSPPYRRENVEQPEFDLVDIERDGPVGRIVLNLSLIHISEPTRH